MPLSQKCFIKLETINDLYITQLKILQGNYLWRYFVVSHRGPASEKLPFNRRRVILKLQFAQILVLLIP